MTQGQLDIVPAVPVAAGAFKNGPFRHLGRISPLTADGTRHLGRMSTLRGKST